MKKEDLKIVRTTTWSAGPGCHGGCGVLAYVRDGKLVKVEGDPDHPWNQGRLCSRCLAITQYIYHPERLTRQVAQYLASHFNCSLDILVTVSQRNRGSLKLGWWPVDAVA